MINIINNNVNFNKWLNFKSYDGYSHNDPIKKFNSCISRQSFLKSCSYMIIDFTQGYKSVKVTNQFLGT